MLPNRKSIRLSGYDYSQNGSYFVTICTQNRINLFGEIVGAIHESPDMIHESPVMKLNEMGKIVGSVLKTLPKRFPIVLNEFQIMPNHVHMVIQIVGAGVTPPVINGHENRIGHENRAPTNNDVRAGYSRPTLGNIIAYFKYQSTKSINSFYRTGGNIPALYPKIWQRNYYEHIIRNEQELYKIQKYIQTNPQIWDRDRNNPFYQNVEAGYSRPNLSGYSRPQL